MSNKRILCWIGLLCILLSLLGLGINISRARELSDYKAGLKKHVEECDGYSEEERQVLFIAIDHIRNPEIIIDDSLIFVYRLSQVFSSEDELDLTSETGRKIELNDWRVDIGDSSRHGNFSVIIDGDTLEFIMQILIA